MRGEQGGELSCGDKDLNYTMLGLLFWNLVALNLTGLSKTTVMSEQGPPIMNELQYCSDNPGSPPQDPLLMALADMNSKLEGIGRLEKKLAEATLNFTGELDLIKTELANLTEARNTGKISMSLSLKKVKI